ncbi:Transcriptional regulator PadR-like family protein [uncultured archaeon]|nr:Transcriptional regulator PadR-like family protein [uncultured archaeon]
MIENFRVVPEIEHPVLVIGQPKLNSNLLEENIVKSHLEIIVLSILTEMPMSGYDLIKEIFARYNVFLSQGTVYSLLYCLKDERIIKAEHTKGNMRTKRYSITEEGEQVISKRIDDFIKAEEYVLNSIKEHRS